MPRIGETSYKGPKRFIEYQEARGRTVEYLRFWHSPADAQAITVHFTDGTRIHIGIEALLKVETEVGQLVEGDLKISKTYRTIVGSLVSYHSMRGARLPDAVGPLTPRRRRRSGKQCASALATER